MRRLLFQRPARPLTAWLALAASLALLRPLGGWTATTPVSVGDDFFSPADVTINQNDTVQWTWTGFIDHSSTSDTGLWDSGITGHGSTFSFQFTSAGGFPYHCNVHSFQTGTVTVKTVAATPPTVTITSPANNAILFAPASLTLSATASAAGGTVSQVQFFQGSAPLGTLTASPYDVQVTGLGTGAYSFSAVATDSNNGKATNSVNIKVNAPTPPVVSAPQWFSPGTFQFSYLTDAGVAYAVDSTLDFSAWTALLTNTAGASSTVFSTTSAGASQTFYRVRRLISP
jgi:plastocyanin